MIRGYKRNATALLGVAATVLFTLPASVAIALGAFFAFRNVPAPYPGHILQAALLLIYLIWLLTPLFGYSLNESYDVSRLFIYPLTMRQIFTATIAASIMDFTVLLLLPALAAVVLGFTYGPVSFVFSGVTILLFLFHTLALGQALLLLSQSLLSARKSRDLMIVLGPVLGFSAYIVFRYVSETATRIDWRSILSSRTWEALGWLPPGMAARAISDAARGQVLSALLAFIALLAVTAATVYLAAGLLQAAYSGETSHSAPRRHKDHKAGASVARGGLSSLMPPVVGAMFDKEVKYVLRDPYFKITLLSVVYMAAVFGFLLIRSPGHEFTRASPFLIWGASAYMLMMEMGLLYNAFGSDGLASATLFTFPASRRQMLLGKNLALFLVLTLVNVVFLALPVAVFRQWALYGPLAVWMALAIVILTAVGNPISVKLPFRVTTQGGRIRRMSAGQGCGMSFIYISANLITGVLMLPVLAGLITPCFWVRPIFFALTIPFCIAYTTGLYLASLRITEPMLLAEDVKMIERLSAEDS